MSDQRRREGNIVQAVRRDLEEKLRFRVAQHKKQLAALADEANKQAKADKQQQKLLQAAQANLLCVTSNARVARERQAAQHANILQAKKDEIKLLRKELTAERKARKADARAARMHLEDAKAARLFGVGGKELKKLRRRLQENKEKHAEIVARLRRGIADGLYIDSAFWAFRARIDVQRVLPVFKPHLEETRGSGSELHVIPVYPSDLPLTIKSLVEGEPGIVVEKLRPDMRGIQVALRYVAVKEEGEGEGKGEPREECALPDMDEGEGEGEDEGEGEGEGEEICKAGPDCKHCADPSPPKPCICNNKIPAGETCDACGRTGPLGAENLPYPCPRCKQTSVVFTADPEHDQVTAKLTCDCNPLHDSLAVTGTDVADAYAILCALWVDRYKE